ncbi:MAG: transglutaminase-like domain-containing protein [Oscillospiraceae bacterium]|nr:transglutaminase-like domain-containing protein [Oscillospiraceae bacterium]
MSKQTAEQPSHRELQARALRNRSVPEPPARRPARPPFPVSQRDASQSAVPAPAEAAPPGRRAALTPFRLVLLAVQLLLLAVTVFGILHFVREREASLMTVCYVIPGREDIRQRIPRGDTAVLLGPVDTEHSTFLAWLDGDGLEETRSEIPVYGSLTYTARMMPRLGTDTHVCYLELDDRGCVRPGETVTVRDFIGILGLLMDTDLRGSGQFTDVEKDDPCRDTAALLKDLGVCSGSRLHPDAPLTRGELIRMLCCFFPSGTGRFEFMDLEPEQEYYGNFCTAAERGWISSGRLVRAAPGAEVTRGELAHILNRVLSRSTGAAPALTRVGTILDVPVTHEYYADLAEASVPHRYRIRNGKEVWTSSEPFPLHEAGPVFSGVRLHWIGEDGSPVVNGSVGDLSFTHNGEITTGDPDLDLRLWEILDTLIDPDTMTREEMLRTVYDYVVHSFPYRNGHVLERGAEGWAAREANRMLDYGGGNCYCYAALFYELARFVGYDARIYSGIVRGEQRVFSTEDGTRVLSPENYTPHGWVEIAFDGVDYIFDPEYEYRNYGLQSMFKGDENLRGQYGYMK